MENKETLEQASKEFANSKKWMDKGAESWVEHTFIEGVKWEQERSYNDMIEFVEWFIWQDITSRGKMTYVNKEGKLITTKELLKQWQQLNK